MKVVLLTGVVLYAVTTFQWATTVVAVVGCVSGLYALYRVDRIERTEAERAGYRVEKAGTVLADAADLDDHLRPPNG